ncbi:MAG: T9SS type A sorting domain-containing protein [Elusimicrobiales bacterium]
MGCNVPPPTILSNSKFLWLSLFLRDSAAGSPYNIESGTVAGHACSYMGELMILDWYQAAARRYGRALLLLCLICWSPLSAAALISASGEYSLEASVVDSGGGRRLEGGQYASRASAGQNVLPEGYGNSVSGEYTNRSGFYNPPHFAFQKGLHATVGFNSGYAALALPAGAVDKEVFDITLNHNPAAQPLCVEPGLINSANLKMETNEGAWSRLFPNHITEMTIFDEQDFWEKPLIKSGLLSMRYSDDNGDGVLDGSYPPVRVETIKTWTLDQELAMWAKLPGASVDTVAREIRAPFMVPGVYSLLGMVDESVKNTYAFPVPFRPNGPKAGLGAGQTGNEAEGITFINVPQVGDVEIYTLDGRLVRKLNIPAGLMVPKIKWDARTAGGERAASGTYIWRVVSGSNSKSGKLMVIW